MRKSISNHKKTLKKAAGILFWLFVWTEAAIITGSELILPSPLSVASALIRSVTEGDFWLSVLCSLGGTAAGYASGVIIAILLAAATSASETAYYIFYPILHIIKATPVASFIILALLWIGKAAVPPVISALMVIPVVWSALFSAVGETDKGLLEVAKVYSFGKAKTLRLVYIPSVMPSLRAACATSAGLAWKAGVAAEVLCRSGGSIGSELYDSKISLETPQMFAWTAVVIILSFILEKAVSRVMGGKNGKNK